MEEKLGIGNIDIRTEHKRSGQIFRGHPNFQKKGLWNDWAKFDWGAHYGHLPGEIWCFVDFTGMPDDFSLEFEGTPLANGMYAVIESSSYCPNEGADGQPINRSEMFTPIIKEVGPYVAEKNGHV